jgi:hypothetical protein
MKYVLMLITCAVLSAIVLIIPGCYTWLRQP